MQFQIYINRLILNRNGLRSSLNFCLQTSPCLEHPRHQEVAPLHSYVKALSSLWYFYCKPDNNRFNGDTLTKTNNKQLTNLGITSNIMQKKLMAWVEKGFG